MERVVNGELGYNEDMLDPAKKEGTFTYADYLGWPEEERWELIEGIAYDMTPAPSTRHQMILVEFLFQIRAALGDGPCRVFVAPFDVRFPEGEDRSDSAISTVVQPDLSVICDPEKLDEAGCLGAPDLVVEILSPSTAFKDQTAKLLLYEKQGIREYWIVNPVHESVLVYCLGQDGNYGKPSEFRKDEKLPAQAVSLIVIELAAVFAD